MPAVTNRARFKSDHNTDYSISRNKTPNWESSKSVYNSVAAMKKTLVIMGTHPNGHITFDRSRTDCDIWMFNEAPNLKNEKGEHMYPNANAFFQLHHEAIWKNPKNRSDTSHYLWLKSGKTPTAYMQKAHKEVPKSVRYPIEDVLSLIDNVRMVIRGKEQRVKYFSSSPDYALALVAKMWRQGKKYKRIEVHGIELEMESEYQYQRTGFGFWIGYLTALGIEIVLYNRILDEPMYGYEGDVALSSADIQKRLDELTKELGDGKDRYQLEAKTFLDSIPGLLRQDISAQIQKELNELNKRSEPAGILNGKIKENLKYLDRAKAMEEATGASVFAMGEFDGPRVSATREYVQVRAEALNLNAQIDPVLKKLLNLKKGSQKRQRAIDEFGNKVAELMNKNMLLLHIIGAIRENQYYIDNFKLSFKVFGGEK